MSHPRAPSTTAPKKGCGSKLVDWMIYKDKKKWLKDMRGSLSLMVSIIATITFQSALNPPGGVVQANFKEDLNCTSDVTPCPGEAVLGVVYPDYYHAFLVCNTISFVASLSVCLLLVSGLALDHAFLTWLLLLSMWITITSLALTYLFGAMLVTPDYVYVSTTVFGRVVSTWIGLLAVIGILLLLRFVARIRSCNRSSATSTINGTTSISSA